ncbi:hypothetical protein MKW94_030405 [Papaver nudicaule]|uniref:Transmembrane protein n=1 Tax=Papaver nudicaule TaxID=74823 RepID=A0AA41V1V3_PAPNU|nr:hypothetical protein [Papaver nudicaule]
MMRPLMFGKVIYVYCFILLVGISMMLEKPHFGCSVEAYRGDVPVFNQQPPPPLSKSYKEVKKMLESRSRKLMTRKRNSTKIGTSERARRPKGAPRGGPPPDPNPVAPVYIGPYTKF